MNRYFDHIFIISRCSNVDRRKHIDEQMKYFGVSNYSYWYVPDYDFENSLIFKENNKILTNHKRCAFGHYSCWKTCYELKYDNVLIIEDDACFIKDIETYNKILNDFNTNWKNISDIFLFDYFYFDGELMTSYSLATCYYVNKKGLEFLIRNHEKYNVVNDFYFNDLRKYREKYPNHDYVTFFYQFDLSEEYNGVQMEYFKEDLEIRINRSETHLAIQQDKLNENNLSKKCYFIPEKL